MRGTPFAAAFALVVALIVAAPASATIVINEIDSDPSDFVELYNDSGAPVDISGYQIKDSTEVNIFTVPGGTSIAAGGSFLVNVGLPGLGSGDSARLFDNLAHQLETYSWTSHAAASYGRCPNGTGPITWTSAITPGSANTCAPAATAWPGGAGISLVT